MPAPGVETEAAAFLARLTAALAPLEREHYLREWEANTHASPEAQAAAAEAEAAVATFLADRDRFQTGRRLLAQPGLREPLLRRSLTLFLNAATERQLPEPVIEDLVRRSKAVEAVFHSFRPEWEGRRVSNNEILHTLRTERDAGRRRAAWEASKRIALEVADPLRDLARRRNDAARSLGHRDYYAMRLELQEVDETELFRLLEELKTATDRPFAVAKRRADEALARRYGCDPADLRPWHYEDPFFQEAPQASGPGLDALFRGRDLVAIARSYTSALGFELGPVLDRSDLFEREAKDQHAFCIDVDREGDVRVLANLRDDLASMDTLLHELGHAAYDVHIPRTLPWTLRTPAHLSTTEGVAMWMGRAPREPGWLRAWVGLDGETVDALAQSARETGRFQMLLTVRWVMVMVYFERALYGDPDREDLGRLWWDLVEEIQLLRRPDDRRAPDWAAKIHLSAAPVYYHNYVLGELAASQLGSAIRRAAGDADPFARPASTGDFLMVKVFAPGATLHWQDLLEAATGRRLSADDFLADAG